MFYICKVILMVYYMDKDIIIGFSVAFAILFIIYKAIINIICEIKK